VHKTGKTIDTARVDIDVVPSRRGHPYVAMFPGLPYNGLTAEVQWD